MDTQHQENLTTTTIATTMAARTTIATPTSVIPTKEPRLQIPPSVLVVRRILYVPPPLLRPFLRHPPLLLLCGHSRSNLPPSPPPLRHSQSHSHITTCHDHSSLTQTHSRCPRAKRRIHFCLPKISSSLTVGSSRSHQRQNQLRLKLMLRETARCVCVCMCEW